MDLALLYSQGTNAKGIAKYDEKDRPLKYAFAAEEIVGKVIMEENNYWKCKVKLLLSKVYLQKQEIDKAEQLVESAREMGRAILGSDRHPLIASKVLTAKIEVLNSRPESEERTKSISEVCSVCVEVSSEANGADSLHNIRPLYTAYTASLHDENGPSNREIVQKMTALKVNGKDMRDNQYMFKAKIVELIMQIAEGLTQQTLVVMMVQLQRVYDV